MFSEKKMSTKKQNNYYTQILKMFFPIFISRVGAFFMSIVDALVLARYNPLHIGYQSIGDTPVIFVMLLVAGLVQGVLFITSEAFGKGNYIACGNALKQSIRQTLLLSTIAIPMILFAPAFLRLFNYTEENILISGRVMQVMSIAIPFASLYMVSQFFLQGIKKPWISTWFVLVANFINLALDLILVNGMFGLPEFGAVGVSIATTVVRLFLAIGLLLYIFRSAELKKYFGSGKLTKLKVNKTQRALGYGATANMLSNESALAFCLFFISKISILSVSAYTLSFRLLMIIGILSISLAVAASIFVGIGLGRKDIITIKKSIFATININIAMTIIIAILSFSFSRQLAFIMASDYDLAMETEPFLRIVAIVIIFNGIQNILTINLRALHDLIVPSIIILIFYPIMVPLLCLLFADEAIQVLQIILSANILTSTGLFLRFMHLIPRYKFKETYF